MDALGLFKRDDDEGFAGARHSDDLGAVDSGPVAGRRASDSHLYKRNLCPVCPSNAQISTPNLFVRSFGDWMGVNYCCPNRSPSTVIPPGRSPSIVVVTRTATETKKITVSAPRATHVGLAFVDNNRDGRYTPGVDDPVQKKWVILRRGNKVLARARTDATGRYILITKVYPKAKLSISLWRVPRSSARTVVTGTNGASRALLPIPPPAISIAAFFDLNMDDRKSNKEKFAVGSTLVIKFLNGSVWETVKLGPKGQWIFRYRHAMPYKSLVLQTIDGKVRRRITLDGAGNGVGMLPIPGVSFCNGSAGVYVLKFGSSPIFSASYFWRHVL